MHHIDELVDQVGLLHKNIISHLDISHNTWIRLRESPELIDIKTIKALSNVMEIEPIELFKILLDIVNKP
jgi:tRNA A-37 threonylcarbamoyl transferase component Bud32